MTENVSTDKVEGRRDEKWSGVRKRWRLWGKWN